MGAPVGDCVVALARVVGTIRGDRTDLYLSAALAEAAPAAEIARWTIESVGRVALLCDAPEFDQRWMDRLLATLPDAPALRLRDFDNAAWTAFTEGVFPVTPALDAVYETLGRRRRRTAHRAAEDAGDLAAAWAAGLRAGQK